MLVQNFLEQSAARFPGKTALVIGKESFSYGQIDRQADCLAQALVAAGVERGDRVAIVLPNSLETVLGIFAVLKAGAAFVVLHSTIKSERLAYVLNNCRAKAVILGAAKLASEWKWLSETPHLRAAFLVRGESRDFDLLRNAGKTAFSLGDVLKNAANSSRPANECIDVDLAALIYTSGTTGKPKGVMMTHLNMVSAATSIATYLENSADDVVMNVLPLAFGYGLYQLLVTFKVGGTLILFHSFAFPHMVLKQIAEQGVTGFAIVPTISATLLQMNLSRYAFPRLRYFTNAAAALPVQHIRRLRTLLPQVKIFSMYGLTECTRVSYLSPDQIDIRPRSVGRAIPNEEVYIVDPDGKRVGAGAIGELVIRGSHIMKGYWEMPEETENRLRPGPLPGEKVLLSGDLFYTDEEGYLYFVSRYDDIIKTRGEKVSPREVEEVLYTLEGVAEAAVIGIPDPILGCAIKAVIVKKRQVKLTEQDVLRHCSAALEDFMIPKFVEFRESLEKTESGKVSRRAVAEGCEKAGAMSSLCNS